MIQGIKNRYKYLKNLNEEKGKIDWKELHFLEKFIVIIVLLILIIIEFSLITVLAVVGMILAAVIILGFYVGSFTGQLNIVPIIDLYLVGSVCAILIVAIMSMRLGIILNPKRFG